MKQDRAYNSCLVLNRLNDSQLPRLRTLLEQWSAFEVSDRLHLIHTEAFVGEIVDAIAREFEPIDVTVMQASGFRVARFVSAIGIPPDNYDTVFDERISTTGQKE